jgi:leucyl-tRNA synthetase
MRLELAKAAANKNPMNIDLKALNNEQRDVYREMHVALKQANFDLQRLQFNTVASACMKILKALEQQMVIVTSDMNTKAVAITNGFSILLRLAFPDCTAHHANTLARVGLRR